jgi:molybdate transport system substrate-binding protein
LVTANERGATRCSAFGDGTRAARGAVAIAALFLFGTAARADELHVAVASNFAPVMQRLVPLFEQASTHKLLVSSGATGKFYAQIKNGAPFEVLLAADAETPARLENEGAAVAGSRFTYAIGKLVLWSAQAGLIDDTASVLMQGRFTRLAVANAKLAPYGKAAEQVLAALNLTASVAAKRVVGENIAQTQQFIASGNAELGFVALSQIMFDGTLRDGSAWLAPQDLYEPIRQDAIILAAGAGKPAPLAFVRFLQSPETRNTIRAYGYDL